MHNKLNILNSVHLSKHLSHINSEYGVNPQSIAFVVFSSAFVYAQSFHMILKWDIAYKYSSIIKRDSYCIAIYLDDFTKNWTNWVCLFILHDDFVSEWSTRTLGLSLYTASFLLTSPVLKYLGWFQASFHNNFCL